jgi:hypothetical protein
LIVPVRRRFRIFDRGPRRMKSERRALTAFPTALRATDLRRATLTDGDRVIIVAPDVAKGSPNV